MSEVRFHLTSLTPIHIGSGQSLEPFEYVVDGDTLYRFTLDGFLPELSRDDQARFVEAVEDSVPATRDFVSRHVKVARRAARFSADVSPAAGELYAGRMEGGIAHPEVFACIRTEERAYIPGSSLKGALRTALLYHAMDKDNPEGNARKLEQTVFRFRTVQQDPFRAFKVGDGAALGGRTRVRSVIVNTQRDGSWSQDIPVLVETVPGALSDRAEVVSEHAVTFDAEFYRYHQRAFRLSPGGVLAACRDFYGAHLAAERDFTRGLPQTAAAYDALVRHAEVMPEHACLVRLAWGSGRDATTVSYGLADAERPTSRRLTDDGYPLGWAELRITQADGAPVSVEDVLEAVPEAPPRPERAGDERPRTLRDLRAGLVLDGRVTRTVQYGAFVDLGVGRDGLIHISQLADRFVHQVEDVVTRGDRVRVEILEVDLERRRIGLKLQEKL
jgi:CRISPR type III-A-associated RAMP protein Csm5